MKKRIFVIDDDRDLLEYYGGMFKDEFELEYFRDGVAAMDRMCEVVPDLIILDVLLIGPTGFSLLNEMQSYADLGAVPVVVVSGVEIKEKIGDYGVVCVFDKSRVLPEDLRGAVRSHIATSG